MGQQGSFWTVDPGDTIYTIATKLSFMDGGQALWNANPDIQTKSNNNPDVLSPGWVLKIPQSDPKTEGGMPVAQQHQFQLPGSHRKLILNLRDQDGNPVQGWQYRFQVASVMKESGDVSASPISIDFDADSLQEETLTDVALQAIKGQPQDPDYTMDSIQLTVGGLDPVLDGLPGRVAVQKILTNLGYFQGQEDGTFGPDTVSALQNFQNVHNLKIDGTANPETCQAMVSSLGNIIAVTPPTDAQTGCDPQDLPLGKGTVAANSSVGGRTSGNTYLEMPPKDAADKKTRLPMSAFHWFPQKAFVAPCDKSVADDGRNIIQMPPRKFVFLDTGRWYEDGRDFGLIWGRHVYLCKYNPPNADPTQNSNPAPTPDPSQNSDPSQNQNTDPGQNQNTDPSQGAGPAPRLDQIFFDGMDDNVTVVTYACVSWAPSTDFDWDVLYLIIPDVHLMDGPTAAIWHNENPYLMHPELDLLDFVKKLIRIDALKDKLQPMQIGDSYDLWVGGSYHGGSTQSSGDAIPYFQANDNCQMKLAGEDNGDGNTDPGMTSAACSLLSDWIHEIQGVNTPWVSGLLPDKRAQIFWAQYSCTQLQNQIDEPDATLPAIAKQVRDGVIPQYKSYVEDLSQNATFSGPYPWMFSDSSDGSLDPLNVHQGLDALQQYVQSAMTTAGDPSSLETDLFDGTSIWLNPAEKALRLLADTYQTKGLTFFYGNHDNYLLNDALCGQAGITPRVPYLQLPGIIVEHAHRLEATFSKIAMGGGNCYDGQISGYVLTNRRWDGLYQSYSDYFNKGVWQGIVGLWRHTVDKIIAAAGVPVGNWFAGQHDQQAYIEEYVDLWLGRMSHQTEALIPGSDPSATGSDPSAGSDPASGATPPILKIPPPHVFVIGHTHEPRLGYITIAPTPSTVTGDLLNWVVS